MDKLVRKILIDSQVYKEDEVLTTSIEELGEQSYKVTFLFPEYQRSKNPLDHISAVQMQAALIEGLCCVVGCLVKKGTSNFPIDLESITNFLLYKESITFRKMLKPNEVSQLYFQVGNICKIKLRRNFYSISFTFKGFISGSCEALLEAF